MRIIQASLATALLIPSWAVSAEIPAASLRTAAQKGLALLESTSPTFIKKGGCNSCHNQFLPAAAQGDGDCAFLMASQESAWSEDKKEAAGFLLVEFAGSDRL